jgi:thiol:disulfide interchange protein DsbG
MGHSGFYKGLPLKHLALALLGALVLNLSACSKNDAPAAPAAVGVNAQSLDLLASTGKGFAVGSLMSTQTVYVLFDPQCPHCGHLWQASLPLHTKVKFVWVPIAFNPGKSLAQGAALLSAVNPTEAMTAHEQSLLGGSGGMSASSSVPAELETAIKRNTGLLTSMGIDSVPFLIAKHRSSGQVVSHNGALDTAALGSLLGMN